MENTGIAAAGEAGIGGKAGIVGTDRDGGAGGGRMVSVVSAVGRRSVSVNRRRFRREARGQRNRRSGGRGETQGPDAVFDGQMVSCALKGQVNFLRLAVGDGMP